MQGYPAKLAVCSPGTTQGWAASLRNCSGKQSSCLLSNPPRRLWCCYSLPPSALFLKNEEFTCMESSCNKDSNLQLPLLLFSELFKSIIAFLRPETCTDELAAVLWVMILANSWHRNERVHRSLYYTRKHKVKILSINLNTATKPWARLWGRKGDVMKPGGQTPEPGGRSCHTTGLDHETLWSSWSQSLHTTV